MPGHSTPCDSQCSICPGRRCVKNGYSPFGTQAHLDFHSKRKLPNYKIWPSYGNYLSLLAGEVRNHTGGMGKDDGMDPDSGIGRQMDHHNGARYPMCQVSYDECLDFCDRLTEIARQQGILPEGYCFSLPTEAQWELAYSCGKEIVLPDNLEKVAWMDFHDANTGAYPVGQKEPNAWGFHDMLGNVWELCADFYHSHRLHGRNPVNWKTDTGNLSTDTGLSVTSLGGGVFSFIPDNEKEIPRERYHADSRRASTGLRVALVPVQQHQLLKKRLKHLHPVPDWLMDIRYSFELIYMYMKTYWKTLTNL